LLGQVQILFEKFEINLIRQYFHQSDLQQMMSLIVSE
jgi:hypothetical protein